MVNWSAIDEAELALKRCIAIEIENEKAHSILFKRTLDQTNGQIEKGRRSPWQVPADFSVPCSGSGRPRSLLGRTSFYFDLSSSAKARRGSKVMSSTKTRFVAGDAATEQHQYVQKHVLRCESAMFAAYMRLLPDKLELLPKTLTEAEGASRRTIWWSVEQGYFTNIHHDPDVVAAYWPAVYDSERKPGLSTLRLHWEETRPSTWQALAESAALPAEARPVVEAAAAAAEGCSSWRHKRLLRDGIRVDEEVCQEVFDLIARLTDTPVADRAVKIERARGGRTQYRLVAELPAELDDVERILIVREFCESLNALGPMFEAVIHEPDHDNDSRNYHLHVIYHDRPADYLDALGKWDMEVRTPVPGRPGRFKPLRKKIVLGWKKGMTRKQAGEAYLKALREMWAEVNNAALVRARKYPRYDPRTYAEMGIDQEPAEHLDNSAARASLAGVPVAGCVRNAERYWSAEWKRRSARIDEAVLHHQALAVHVAEYIENFPEKAEAQDLSKLLAAFIAASTELDQLEQALLRVDLYEDMVRSRALKTKAAAVRLVRAIDRGDATAAAKYGPDIAERGIEAFDWLRAADEEVAPLAEARQRRGELRALVVTTVVRFEPLVTGGESRIEHARRRAGPDLPSEEHAARKNCILAAITAENLAIIPGRDGILRPSGVIGLDPADAAFLERCSAAPFLRRRFEIQELEIGRLRGYRRKHPEFMTAMLVDAEVPGKVPQAVRTLLSRYRDHPEIRRWTADANEAVARREEDAEADLAAREMQAEAEAAEAAAAELAKERGCIEAFLTKAKDNSWEVLTREGRYCIADEHINSSGVADLVRADGHHQWVQECYAALAVSQRDERRRVLGEIAALKKVGFAPDRSILPIGFAPDVDALFKATRRWTGISHPLDKRAMAIEEEAMKEIQPLLREGFIRISIDIYAVCSVPRGRLPDAHAEFLDRHEKRPLVQKKLLPLGRETRRLYNELREKIIATSPTPATAQGALDPSKLPSNLRAAAAAWAGEEEFAQVLKDKLVSEGQVATLAIARIERENLGLGKTASGWRFDEKLPAHERSCLKSTYHAASIDQRLEGLLKQREREAQRAEDRLTQAAEERRRATEAAEERRRAAEAADAARRRVDALLVRIETQNLGFDTTAVDWNLDPCLGASDRSLLRSAGHVGHVKTRLERIAAERHRLATEAAERRCVEGLLQRFEGGDLAFNLTAPDLGLDARLDPAQRTLLRHAKYQELVQSRLEAVAAERERRRQEAEAVHYRKRQLVLALLDRIQNDRLLFEPVETGGWELDLKLTAEERALLRSPAHSSLVEERLREIAEEREDIRKEDERRLAEERAELDRALDRICRETVDFDLAAPEWGLADRISAPERRLLCSNAYRPVVQERLREVAAARRQQALEQTSAARPVGGQVDEQPASSGVAQSSSPATEQPGETDGDDNFGSVVEAWRDLRKGKG